jgi:hypothetical protein
MASFIPSDLSDKITFNPDQTVPVVHMRAFLDTIFRKNFDKLPGIMSLNNFCDSLLMLFSNIEDRKITAPPRADQFIDFISTIIDNMY